MNTIIGLLLCILLVLIGILIQVTIIKIDLSDIEIRSRVKRL